MKVIVLFRKEPWEQEDWELVGVFKSMDSAERDQRAMCRRMHLQVEDFEWKFVEKELL